jgi:hypothetical protein
MEEKEAVKAKQPLRYPTHVKNNKISPMFDPMSSRLNSSSSITEMDESLNLKSLRQSPNFSWRIANLPVKRKLNPSSCIWQRSTRMKGREEKDLKECHPIEGMTKMYHDTLKPEQNPESTMVEDLMEGNHRLHLNRVKESREKEESYNSQKCRGMDDQEYLKYHRTPAALKPQISSVNLTETSNPRSCILDSHLEHQGESLCPNGNESSKEKPLTLIKSSRHSIVLQLIQRERLALETQRLALEGLKRSGKLSQVLNGLRPGDPLRGRLLSYLNTEVKSWPNTETTSNDFSLRKNQDPMVRSSYLIKGLEMRSEEDKPFCSPITIISPPCTQPPCRMTELNTEKEEEVEVEELLANPRWKCALGSTALEDVDSQSQAASTDMIVKDVDRQGMASQHVRKEIEEDVFGSRPRYLRHNLWALDCDPKMTAAEWTCQARALPRPPLSEWENAPVLETLKSRSDLFKIVSPVKVEELRKLTRNHPNQPFVESVLEGLSNGFWPWASTNMEGYPLTHDESKHVALTAEKEEFISAQIKHEQVMDRMSNGFGQELLPGMYCMPQYVVPKPHTDGWRLVNDLSAGPYSLNSMVDRRYISGYPLDNLSHFGELLLRRRKEEPNVNFLAWKSDIAEAYRICPMHKLWQIKQVVRLQGELMVDRVNVFGGSGSGPIFISVNALVAWVAEHEREVVDLVYVDDSFGVEVVGRTTYYPPYNESLPTQQTKLLELWDQIGIPHKPKKQISGTRLTILGILVDMEQLTFTLPEEARDRLLKELSAWSQRGVRKKVKEWQQIAGWINWALNVFPLLRPALNNVYSKLRGKEQDVRVWANNAIREDLEWAKSKVEVSDGVRLLKSLVWDVSKATCFALTDACPRGFAFWYPEFHLGFTASTPAQTPATQITFYETLAILSVLDDARRRFPSGSKLVVYTDNFSAVAMFNSLRALPEYNCLLKTSIDIILDCHFDLRVFHVPGVENEVADALSRGDLVRALQIHPKLIIKAFEPFQRIERRQSTPILRPPRHALGAAVY